MVAGVDELPTNRHYSTTLSGVTVGSFNKILKLPKIGSNSTYYILIEC